jgi:hypothetical protein
MATSEGQLLDSHRTGTTNDHQSAFQPETRPQPIAAGPAARLLIRDFPGWLCWYGGATRSWWGLPPAGCWYPALIEAATPDELAARVHQIRAADRHIADRPHS